MSVKIIGDFKDSREGNLRLLTFVQDLETLVSKKVEEHQTAINFWLREKERSWRVSNQTWISSDTYTIDMYGIKFGDSCACSSNVVTFRASGIAKIPVVASVIKPFIFVVDVFPEEAGPINIRRSSKPPHTQKRPYCSTTELVRQIVNHYKKQSRDLSN